MLFSGGPPGDRLISGGRDVWILPGGPGKLAAVSKLPAAVIQASSGNTGLDWEVLAAARHVGRRTTGDFELCLSNFPVSYSGILRRVRKVERRVFGA